VKLRKLRNGNIYWVHFTLNGEFWRKSTCTSNRAEAHRKAEEIVREARAGNIQRTYTSAERRDRIGETQRRSQSDPETQKAKKAPWTPKARERHGRKMRIRAKGKVAREHISIATTQGYDRKRQEMGNEGFHRWASARTKKAWERDDYRKRQVRERQKRGRSRKFRRQQRAQTTGLWGTEEFRKAVAEGHEKSSVARLRAKGYIVAPGGLAAPAAAKNPTRGRRRVTEVDYRRAMALRDRTGLSWKDIAKELDYDNWAKGGISRKAAADRIRVAVSKLRPNEGAAPILGGEK
jgi:hypothetical protein